MSRTASHAFGSAACAAIALVRSCSSSTASKRNFANTCPKSPTSKRFPEHFTNFAMNLGYNTNGSAHHRLEDALTILAELGYASVAITLDYHALNPFDADISQQCDRLRLIPEKLKMRCVIETGARFLLDPRQKHQPT